MIAPLCVVTVSCNSAAVLPRFLASVPQNVPAIVADNSSTDESTVIAAQSGARILRLEHNVGYGAACNAAAAVADAEYLLFANPDVVFAEGSFEAFVAAARKYPAAAFNPSIYDGSRRRFRRWSRLLPEQEFWKGDAPEQDCIVPVLSGACILVRKSDFARVDGFDPAIFLYHEDDDLSLRLKQAGVELRLAADAVVRHAAGHSSERSARTGRIKGVAMGQSLVYAMDKHGLPFDIAAERRRTRLKLLLPHVFLKRARRAKHEGFLAGLKASPPPAPLPEYVPLTTSKPPQSDVRLIAWYLPQFHPIPENDAAWGQGFTEWTNVGRAFPVYDGHDQPRVPGELGTYDLRDVSIMRRQVELAKLYGIGGFAFHFYWFGGKTLLETPLANYLADPSLDLPFMLSWANENWSRRWSGSDKDVIVAQQHSPEDDLAFIRHVERYFRDPRYIRIDGKPVLSVYRPSEFPDIAATIRRWRAEMERLGHPGIYLIATNAFDYAHHARDGFDALAEFPPHGLKSPDISKRLRLSPLREGGRIRDYTETVANAMRAVPRTGEVHPGVMPGWDNSPRRPLAGNIYHGASPSIFRDWLVHAIARARKNPVGRRFVFINAWNEWAESAYLEPDARSGYANLQAVADALRVKQSDAREEPPSELPLAVKLRAFWRHPFSADKRARYLDLRTPAALAASRAAQSARMVHLSNVPAQPQFAVPVKLPDNPRVAIVVHAFYPELLPEILDHVSALPPEHRLFVSTVTEHETEIARQLAERGREHVLRVLENRGRDILPFLQILREVDPVEFPLVAKVHTKKSPHRRDGDLLRRNMIERLLAGSLFAGNATSFLNDPLLGMLGTGSQFLPIRDYLGANRAAILDIAARLGLDAETSLGGRFFAGSMFMARTDALRPLVDFNLQTGDFEPEQGQLDGTLAHALERAFALSTIAQGLRLRPVGEYQNDG